MVLKGAGYAVLEAGDGETALALLDGRKIGMAVCDVNMPRMNGIEFVKAAQAPPAYRFFSVWMLTTESQEGKKEEGRAAGAKVWMVKPFAPSSLLNAVSKFCLAQVSTVMARTLVTAEETNTQDRLAVSMSGKIVEDVLNHMREMGASAEPMHHHGSVVRSEVEKLLMAMQFQDRVSQILSGVNDDMSRMKETLETSSPDELPSIEDWMGAFSQTYTMEDQKHQSR